MTTSPAPLLQEYRALLVFDALPAGCIAHLVTDAASAPHLRPAEFAIVDTADREPAPGELFVVRYASPLREAGYQDRIVEARVRHHHWPGGDGPLWWVAPYVRPRSLDEMNAWIERGRPLVMSDGPYEGDRLARRFVGRVVGILAPAFEEPRRLPATKGGTR